MSDRREGIERAARKLYDQQRSVGNSKITQDDCRRRVAGAVEKGDRKRANDNR
jgi:hypothetical protein